MAIRENLEHGPDPDPRFKAGFDIGFRHGRDEGARERGLLLQMTWGKILLGTGLFGVLTFSNKESHVDLGYFQTAMVVGLLMWLLGEKQAFERREQAERKQREVMDPLLPALQSSPSTAKKPSLDGVLGLATVLALCLAVLFVLLALGALIACRVFDADFRLVILNAVVPIVGAVVVFVIIGWLSNRLKNT